MDDDFYEPLPKVISYPSGLVTHWIPDLVLGSPVRLITAVVLAALVIAIATRLLSGSDSEPEKVNGKNGRTVWLLPYWLPVVGHGYQLQVSQMVYKSKKT